MRRTTLIKPPPRRSRRSSLDQVGMKIVEAWAGRSTCARRAVGCALFDANGFLLATGYNGPASGQKHCIQHPCPGADLPSGTGLSKCEAIHAEANALLRCQDVSKIDTCYVSVSPCVDCVKLLLNTGCRRIVFGSQYAHDREARELWTREWTRKGVRSWDQHNPFARGFD